MQKKPILRSPGFYKFGQVSGRFIIRELQHLIHFQTRTPGLIAGQVLAKSGHVRVGMDRGYGYGPVTCGF